MERSIERLGHAAFGLPGRMHQKARYMRPLGVSAGLYMWNQWKIMPCYGYFAVTACGAEQGSGCRAAGRLAVTRFSARNAAAGDTH